MTVGYRQILWLFLVLASSAMGEPPCVRMFSELNDGPSRVQKFWERTAPLKAAKGKDNHVFKFGFDAELWHVSDIIAIIAKDPVALAAARAKLREAGDFYSVGEIQELLGFATREEAMAVIEGTPIFPQLTDVKPEALRRWKHGNDEKAHYAKLLWEEVNASLKNRNIPVSAKLEEFSGEHKGETAVELVMDGAIASPAEFKKLVDWLYEEVDAPETHFHVSVPKEYIASDDMIFAARALETKILLEQVMSDLDFNGQGHAPWDDSTFHLDIAKVIDQDMPQSERGVVRVESERWVEPFVAHDVEVRDWINKDHGLESLYTMTQLVLNNDDLRGSPTFKASELWNTSPPNLNGALRYAALMLEGRLPRNKDFIRADLINLARGLERDRVVNDAVRKKIADYLKEHHVLYYLNLNAFLNHKIMPANKRLPLPPPAPLPEPVVEKNVKLAFTRDAKGIVHMPVTRVREGKTEVPIAEFILDPHKAARFEVFNVRGNEKVSFFDWNEPAKTDYEQVRKSGIEALQHAFGQLGQDRIVAIGKNHYERTNLSLMGFTMVRGTEKVPGGPRYELNKEDFGGEELRPAFRIYTEAGPGVHRLNSNNAADLPEDVVENGLHYEYYIPNEYKAASMRMSIEKTPAREGGRPKHLVEYSLDTDKPWNTPRIERYLSEHDRPALFDWEEADRVADADYDTVYDGARRLIDHAFNDFSLSRVFAVANTKYMHDVMDDLGFRPVPGENLQAREVIYEITRDMRTQRRRQQAQPQYRR